MRQDSPVRRDHPAAEHAGDGARAPRRAGVSGEGQDLPGDGAGRARGDGRVPGRHGRARRGADGGGLHGADAHRRRRRRRAHDQVRAGGFRPAGDRRGAPRDEPDVPALRRLVHAQPADARAGRDGHAGPGRRGGARAGVRDGGVRLRADRRHRRRVAGAGGAADGACGGAGFFRLPHDGGRFERGRPGAGDGVRAEPARHRRPGVRDRRRAKDAGVRGFGGPGRAPG